MVQPSSETVALVSEFVESLVSSGFPPELARLYSHHTRLRENQPGLASWSQNEANNRLNDVMLLLEAASIQKQTADDQWQKTVLRAGEILEWLPSTNTNSNEVSTRLLSAACYQLAGYPARAQGLLREESSEDNESRILIALLKADFVELMQQISTYWSQTIPEIQHTSQSDTENKHIIQTMVVRETVSALGLLCAVMRWGEDPRIQKALDKLSSVSKTVLHGRSPYSWILSKLCAEVAVTYIENTMWQHLDILLRSMSVDGRAVFERYLRYSYQEGRSMAWPSQIRGIQALTRQESFALCTPTGSGKTAVAELAILQSLFPIETADQEETPSQAPLVIYLVPSRALATEVEAKLSRILQQSSPPFQPVTVTGLYGGTDWGPTDAWLTTDEKTVLICTYEKAEALMKFLGSFFLPRTALIVIDEAHTVQFSGTRESLQKSENRALRLESLGARLFTHISQEQCRIVALSAVAASAENALARWITHQDDATAIKTFYRSTRQLIGRLECIPGRRFEIRYDLLDSSPLEFSREEQADRPYIPNPFPIHPPAPDFQEKSFVKKVRPYLLWAAIHLASPNDLGQQRSVLISISERINDYAKDFLTLLNETWADEELPNFFQEPTSTVKMEIWQKCLESCADYYTTTSREYRLLAKGIVVHHGKMPGLMSRLLIEVINQKIVHVVMATSTLSEGVNLPFETVLIPNLKRWSVDDNAQVDFSVSELKNLVGRSGRPGFGTEGRSLVLLPEQPVSSKERRIRRLYFSLISDLQVQQTNTDDGASSPLSELITHLRTQWSRIVQDGTDADFLVWLEQAAPLTMQFEDQDLEETIESLDSLDNILLATIVEVEQYSSREIDLTELEDALKRIWQQTYAYYASQNQTHLEELFVIRGRALKSTIYPLYSERKRLYKTSLPPRSGNQLLILYQDIRGHLETGANYISFQEEQQFIYIRNAVQLISEVNTFNVSDLGTVSWEVILRWWLCHRRAPRQPRETQISKWHNLVNKSFYYRFNWGLGSVLALAIDEAFGEMPLEPYSLENWPRIGLPWIVFWMKELIVWGTLDPVSAYLLARVSSVSTRTQAEELSQQYYQSVSNLEPNAQLNPIAIKNWTQQSFGHIEQRTIQSRPIQEISVSLIRNFSRASKQSWRVIPVEVGEEIHWLDPAGFPLASCQKPDNWQADYLQKYDFVLDSSQRIVNSMLYL